MNHAWRLQPSGHNTTTARLFVLDISHVKILVIDSGRNSALLVTGVLDSYLALDRDACCELHVTLNDEFLALLQRRRFSAGDELLHSICEFVLAIKFHVRWNTVAALIK